MSSLELVDLHKEYRSKGRASVQAVRGLDLRIESGELVGLLGPSGCGKSTTLRMVAGLEGVTTGDIKVDGRSVAKLPPAKRNIGIAFENYALYPPLTVRDNIAFGLTARGLSDPGRRVAEVAERIGISDILDAKPAALSSGQKQRVALARAIAREPDVLLLDEPLSHLDAAQRDVTRRELRRLQQELGYTTILVTHDQEEALSLADRVVVMEAGIAKQVDQPDAVYDDPADLFVARFVGEPAMNLLEGIMLDARSVRVGDTTLPVRVGDAGEAGSASGAVVVGVRPEDLHPVPGGLVNAEVVVHEDLQEYGLATVELPGTPGRVTVQTDPGVTYAPGEAVALDVVAERVYLFHPETGARLR